MSSIKCVSAIKFFCHGICGVYCLLALMWPASYIKIFSWPAMPATLDHPDIDTQYARKQYAIIWF